MIPDNTLDTSLISFYSFDWVSELESIDWVSMKCEVSQSTLTLPGTSAIEEGKQQEKKGKKVETPSLFHYHSLTHLKFIY